MDEDVSAVDGEGQHEDAEDSDVNDKDVDQTRRDMDNTSDINDVDLKPKAKTSSDSNDDDLKPKAKKGKMDANTGISKGTLEVEKTNDVGWLDV